MPRDTLIRKVLMLGSGPIVIGQAAEFDYAGAQACRVLKSAGVNVVLVNSNPATIMTDKALADEIYLEPLTVATVRRIIEKEKPDSLLAGLGGQTALTLAMQLEKEGFLAANGVRLLGINIDAINKAEDRELFRNTMMELGQPVIPSDIAHTVPDALQIAAQIGFPVIVRPAFTLGGAGGGVAENEEQLRLVSKTGLEASPIGQILVEKYIYGWKEIEFEVMRDHAGSTIAVCSMENFDPVGVHTGDSIVVAPALTLSDKEFQMLRSAALKIIDALGIEGGCNCQFALHPTSMDYAVIEVNPRVSRSSALASKATGYPIAKVATYIALGYNLDEIPNAVTGKTCALFEPTLDYCVVKLPKWPFEKFAGASRVLGTQMKATGEVMSIAPTFEAALMKAVRGAEGKVDTLNHPDFSTLGKDADWAALLDKPDDLRLFKLFGALKAGISVETLHQYTRIDRWFLWAMERLAQFEKELAGCAAKKEAYLPEELRQKGKLFGYTDVALQRLSGKKTETNEQPAYRMVDTCGGEFAAKTPYFYAAYGCGDERCTLPDTGKPRIMVLGSGPIRIGQGIEFDYSSVHCVWTLQQLGYEVILVNNNPETVSTDFDTADRLYFEPLTEEDVLHIVQTEQPRGVVVAFGGQTAIRLTGFLDALGIPILGTSAASIDLAEDRGRFDALLEEMHIKRPQSRTAMDEHGAARAAEELGFPVLLRPSYVIGGQNMVIAHNEGDVRTYMRRICAGGIDNPVLIDQYLMGKELEVDAISDGVDVLIPGVMEHIERAGVHSGDSIAVYPPYSISDLLMEQVVDCAKRLTLAMQTKGLVNIQFLIYQNELYVIEVNPRASRTVPYISKVTGVPMVDLAARMMVGERLVDQGYGTGLFPAGIYTAVKVPVFSFQKLSDANATLSPEMKSTGEVLGLGATRIQALFKGLVAAGFRIPAREKLAGKGVLLSVSDEDKFEVVRLAKKLDDLGLHLYATQGTAHEIHALGAPVTVVEKLRKSDTLLHLVESGELAYLVVTGDATGDGAKDFIRLHQRALQCAVPCLTAMDTANALADILKSRYSEENTEPVDINHLRTRRQRLPFAKMQGSGDDYVFFENFDGRITCPEALCLRVCDRNFGIGGMGIVLMENSAVADVKMRMFNRDGSEGKMAGNCIRCVGKYLYDKQLTHKSVVTVETKSGIKRLRLFTMQGHVSSVEVDMGRAVLTAGAIPVCLPCCAADAPAVHQTLTVAGQNYQVTCISMGNPHCVVFCDKVDGVNLPQLGPQFENSPAFPDRVNTEFVRVIHSRALKMRVWERSNGETMACGTGACAAAVAAVENGFSPKNAEITVKVPGGDLLVRVTDDTVFLTGNAELVYEGVFVD